MTIAALELNDQSLLIQSEDGSLVAEPGFGRLTADGVETGEEARSVAWREPQHVYNQYWCHLDQKPLASRHRFARHHADIAFAQLQKIWKEAGSPASLIILVPGSFSHDQLSLLLGMVEALPSRTNAVIDSAAAACMDVTRETLYVDVQMHDSVLTLCRPKGDTVEIADQEIFPGFGMVQIHNAVARHISDLLIESYRFDPLHSSDTEQAIFDRMPHWLTRLRWEGDVSTRLTSDRGELPCILNRDAIRAMIGERLGSVRSFLEKWQGSSLLLSHASGPLTGLVEEFAEAEVASPTTATERCLSRQAEILDQGEELYRVRSLHRVGFETAVNETNGELPATHLLCGNIALPLSKPVSIRIEGNTLQMSSELDEGAALTVVLRNRSLETLQREEEVSLPPTCRPGESIRIREHEVKLIRVGGD